MSVLFSDLEFEVYTIYFSILYPKLYADSGNVFIGEAVFEESHNTI